MTVIMDLCEVMMRVKDAHIDDVKATSIKENTCLLYMQIFTSQTSI